MQEVISSEEGLLYTVRWDEHDEDEEVETEGFTVEDIKAPAAAEAAGNDEVASSRKWVLAFGPDSKLDNFNIIIINSFSL